MVKGLGCQNCGAALETKFQSPGVIRCGYCGTNNVLEPKVHAVMAQDSHRFASQLFRALDDSFSMDDLQDLAVHLNRVLPGGYAL